MELYMRSVGGRSVGRARARNRGRILGCCARAAARPRRRNIIKRPRIQGRTRDGRRRGVRDGRCAATPRGPTAGARAAHAAVVRLARCRQRVVDRLYAVTALFVLELLGVQQNDVSSHNVVPGLQSGLVWYGQRNLHLLAFILARELLVRLVPLVLPWRCDGKLDNQRGRLMHCVFPTRRRTRHIILCVSRHVVMVVYGGCMGNHAAPRLFHQ